MESTLHNPGAVDVLWIVAAFVFTLALIGLTAFVARKLLTHIPSIHRKGEKARLEVVEWRPIDGKHQLYLLRRDDVEHLVLLCANGSPVVIEKRIRNDHDRVIREYSRHAPSLGDPVAPLKAGGDAPFPLGPASSDRKR